MTEFKELTEAEIIQQAIDNSRPDDAPYYHMYAIMRTDLDMPFGKLLSQSGHAFTDALKNAKEHHPERYGNYRSYCNEEKNAFNGGAKVCMKSKNSSQLTIAYNMARKAGIPCAIMIDKGHILPPHFKGQHIITALGIGPCTQEEARHITKRFTCF